MQVSIYPNRQKMDLQYFEVSLELLVFEFQATTSCKKLFE